MENTTEEKYVDIVNCDNCDEEIILDKNGYFILEKGEDEYCWCRPCFEVKWRVMRDDGWECDDFEYAEEESEDDEEDDKGEEDVKGEEKDEMNNCTHK